MEKRVHPQCAQCESKACRDGKDCFARADRHRSWYDDEHIAQLHRAASTIEGRYYGKETRLSETILYARELGYTRIGLAFCIGLSEEARRIEDIFAKHFEVVSVCCKAGGIDKKDFQLQHICANRREVMCNPAGQALLLNEADTQLNVMCGLCVGHDAIFTKVSLAPVTTLITKDRVLAHNPAGALYCQYVRTRVDNLKESPDT